MAISPRQAYATHEHQNTEAILGIMPMPSRLVGGHMELYTI